MTKHLNASLLGLPLEVIIMIFDYLPAVALPTLCMTHSLFNEILKDEHLWRKVVLAHVPKRSYFDYASIVTTENTRPKEGADNPTQSSLLHTSWPYQSYHQLYILVMRRFSWMIGIWAGNQAWSGSLIEFFYSQETGCIEDRELFASASYSYHRAFSLDRNVLWRDFAPVVLTAVVGRVLFMESREQPPSRDHIFRIRCAQNMLVDSNTAMSEIWPTIHIPAEVRVSTASYVHPTECDAALVRDPTEFSEVHLARSSPVNHFTRLRESQLAFQYYYKLSQQGTAPPGFEIFEGLYMGDYNAHGTEMVFLYYPTPTSLYAVKITGDVNVPRGELTWAIDNLESPLRICQEHEWRDATAYKGRGQISPHAFSDPQWIETEIIMYAALKSDQKTSESPMSSTALGPASVGIPRSASQQSSAIGSAGIAVWWKDISSISLFRSMTDIGVAIDLVHRPI